MKSSDRTILIGVIALAFVAAFWFLVLAPKRQQASDLETQVTTLESQVAQVEATAASGEQAKAGFKDNYRQLVTLGKAIPVDADTPSLLTQLQTLSSRADVTFQSITLGGGGSGAAAPVTAPTATEATASLLPIGAAIGPAGLPVMPYQLEFSGGFFEIADFFGAIDAMVDAKGTQVSVNGRLLTIDSFTLAPLNTDTKNLTVSVQATSYLSPADQGTTGGATPSGPLGTAPVPAVAPSTEAPAGVAPAVVAN